jgi:vitamin-K-epoxide reductase (warfarin-sensitive)
MKKKFIIALFVFAFIGFLLSLYALLIKYGVTSGSVCTINDTFNCDLVNQSSYSDFFGIPVALLGAIAYGFICLGALFKYINTEDKQLTQFLLITSFGGLLFSLYLTSIEAFVLHVWCMICIGQQVSILGTALLTAKLYTLEK